MGIEPTRLAWKARVLPLNYTRTFWTALILYYIFSVLSIGLCKLFRKFNFFIKNQQLFYTNINYLNEFSYFAAM